MQTCRHPHPSPDTETSTAVTVGIPAELNNSAIWGRQSLPKEMASREEVDPLSREGRRYQPYELGVL